MLEYKEGVIVYDICLKIYTHILHMNTGMVCLASICCVCVCERKITNSKLKTKECVLKLNTFRMRMY